jgi:NTP pyrophosphatase (non-canonical NTP hydrolase)
MRETQTTINQWQAKRFPDASYDGVINHLREEVAEFFTASDEDAAEEAADIVILLYCWAMYQGIDLQDQIDWKMAKNRARKWNIQSDGTGRHT